MTNFAIMAGAIAAAAILAAPAPAGVPLKGVGGKHPATQARQAGAPLKGVGASHVTARKTKVPAKPKTAPKKG